MPPPYVSKIYWIDNLEPSSPALSILVASGDFVFFAGRSRPGGGVPVVSSTGASSSWTILVSDNSRVFGYRRATADEFLTVQVSFPGGFGGANWYNADLFLWTVAGGVRADAGANTGTNSASVTVDGFTATSSNGGPDAVALAVVYSSDGFALPVAAFFGDAGMSSEGATTLSGGLVAAANPVPSAVGTWIRVRIAGGQIFEFPRTIEYRAVGGDSLSTSVNAGGGGAEDREANRELARRKWKVSLVTPKAFEGRRQEFIDLLLSFFLVMAGKCYAFRVFDALDHQAQGEELVLVGGNVYQLVKRYQIGSRTYVRKITKPITGGVVDWEGNPLPDTFQLYSRGNPVGCTIDPETGLVTSFSDTPLTADFQFHFPARFDTDELAIALEESFVAEDPVASIAGVDLIEVLPDNF